MLLTDAGPQPLMNLDSCGSARTGGRGRLMGKKYERSKTGLSLSLSLSLFLSLSLSLSLSLFLFSVKAPAV